jgi:hypothetical protein
MIEHAAATTPSRHRGSWLASTRREHSRVRSLFKWRSSQLVSLASWDHGRARSLALYFLKLPMTSIPREIAHAGKFSHLRGKRPEGRIEIKNEPGGLKCELNLATQLLSERPYHTGAEASPGRGLNQGAAFFRPCHLQPLTPVIDRPLNLDAPG